MRFDGMLKSWNDERGFGFVEPLQGGEDVFVHITAFRVRGVERPHAGEAVSFEIELGPQGKKRAKNVEPIRPTRVSKRKPRESAIQKGDAALLAIPVFIILYLAVIIMWTPPAVIAAVYIGASLATFLVYSRDKSAARRNARRIPEETLHVLALAGGWPGALLAQQCLRHKSIKAEFRFVFWCTVGVNVVAFVVLCSQLGPSHTVISR